MADSRAPSGRPSASSPDALRRMRRQRPSDTRPEVALRRQLHAAGFRYRTDFSLPLREVRRKADIAFRGVQLAVFVDGCFWHRCPEHGTAPRANADWWTEKLDANVARDRHTDTLLTSAGWSVVRVWEHEDPAVAAERIAQVIAELRHGNYSSR